LNKYSREIGLYAFTAMLLHLSIYLADKGFQLSSLVDNLHLILATIASVILLILAVTSNKWSMKAMGKNWKLLHRSVYAVGILMELHVMFINLPRINPRGVLLALVVAALLVVRIPAVKRYFIQRRTRTVPASLPA
jgi:sulfoxide reductase heme-binding subunit YedZ